MLVGNNSMMGNGSTASTSVYTNGSSSPKMSRQQTSADVRAATVHGAVSSDDYGMRKPTKLEALRLPTPKKGKKKSRQQTWDNIDDY